MHLDYTDHRFKRIAAFSAAAFALGLFLAGLVVANEDEEEFATEVVEIEEKFATETVEVEEEFATEVNDTKIADGVPGTGTIKSD